MSVNLKHWLVAAITATFLAAIVQSSEAASMRGIRPDVETVAGPEWNLERVAFRRCWRQGGRRLCRWHSVPRYHLPEAFYNYAPNTFPTARPPWARLPYSAPSPNSILFYRTRYSTELVAVAG